MVESEDASELRSEWRVDMCRQAIICCVVLVGGWKVSDSYGTIPAFSKYDWMEVMEILYDSGCCPVEICVLVWVRK